MKNKTLPILLVLIVLYFLLKYYVPYGYYIIYPVNLLVTFMHEFWHAFLALITGGSVESLQVNTDGSWVTTTSGGWRVFVLMGGYIWSAIFWNILLYIWLKGKKRYSEKVLYILSALMVVIAVFWFSSMISSILLFILAWWLILLVRYSDFDRIILQFLWVASLLFIIEDFNVGPSSDLAKFEEIFIIIPESVWMIIWLVIVLVITGYNLKAILRK